MPARPFAQGAVLALILATACAFAQTTPSTSPNITWAGTDSTNWFVAGNWNPNRVPLATDNVGIGLNGTSQIIFQTEGPQATARTVTFGVVNDGTYTPGNLTVSGGVLTVTLAASPSPGLQLLSGSTLQIQNGGTVNVLSSSVDNFGTIDIGTNGNGGRLNTANLRNEQGGTINGGLNSTNPITIVNAGQISGLINPEVVTGTGIVVSNGSGNITNDPTGRISGAVGIELDGGGSVTNQAGGSVTGTAGNAIVSSLPFSGVTAGSITVDNSGTITGSASGINIGDGGTITNNTTGTIRGTGDVGIATAFPTPGAATQGPVNIVNSGQILGLGGGVNLTSGGSVTNNAGGSITGTVGSGVAGVGTTTVVNAGTISGTNGITFNNGGTITNNAGGRITGTIDGVASSLSGFGVGAAAVAAAAPAVIAPAVSIVNSGTISGANGIEADTGGSITNNTGGLMEGTRLAGIVASAAALEATPPPLTVVNSGTISGITAGIELDGGGSIINETGGSIIAAIGNPAVASSGSSLSFSNAGTITGDVTLASFANQAVFVTGSAIAGNLNLGTNAGTTLTLDGAGSERLSEAVTGQIIFAGSLTKQGTGTWTIDKSLGNYPGGTTVNSGTLTDALTNALGTGGITVTGNSSVLRVDQGVTLTNPILLVQGGTVDNAGTIQAPPGGLLSDVGGSQVINEGTGVVTNNFGDAVVFNAGGTLTNKAAGLIESQQASGVNSVSGSVTITNSGNISGTNGVIISVAARSRTMPAE